MGGRNYKWCRVFILCKFRELWRTFKWRLMWMRMDVCLMMKWKHMEGKLNELCTQLYVFMSLDDKLRAFSWRLSEKFSQEVLSNRKKILHACPRLKISEISSK